MHCWLHPIGHFSFLECTKFPLSHNFPRYYFTCLKFFLYLTLVYIGSTYGSQLNYYSEKPSLTPSFWWGKSPLYKFSNICLLFIIRLVSVKAGTVCLLISAFYFQKPITCLLAHSRCSIFIQCMKDRKVLLSLSLSLGSALLISLYLCQFNSFFYSVDVHTIFKAQSKALKNINKQVLAFKELVHQISII